MRPTRGRTCLAATAAALALGALAAPAPAAVTIGQLDPAPGSAPCDGTFDLAQPTVISGNGYVVPSTGGVTAWTVRSWSTNVSAVPGQAMSLKIFRTTGSGVFTAVGLEGPHALAPGLNTFPADVEVRPGDILGLHVGPNSSNCAFDAPGEIIWYSPGTDLPLGVSATFQTDSNYRLNASAVLVASNDFKLKLSKVKRRANGTAVLPVQVPNPGALTVGGKGVKGSSAGAVAAKKVAAGKAKLVIRAKGAKKAKLLDTGRVKVKPKITYRPKNGEPSTRSFQLVLKTS